MVMQRDEQVGGHISILDDCTFRVTGFNYDGLAPAAHWWGGNGLEQDQLRHVPTLCYFCNTYFALGNFQPFSARAAGFQVSSTFVLASYLITAFYNLRRYADTDGSRHVPTIC